MPNQYYARPGRSGTLEDGQKVHEHLANVGSLAEEFAAKFTAGPWGRTAGLLHDVGKYSEAFQRRLAGLSPRMVDHSTAGAKEAVRLFPKFGKMIAYAIAGHHAGLPNGTGAEGSSLRNRLMSRIPECPGWDPGSLEISKLLWPAGFKESTTPEFQLAFFVRMLFSCIVDADRLDAERFAAPSTSNIRWTTAPLRDRLPSFFRELKTFSAGARDSAINRIRAEVLARCIEAAGCKPGLFSLTVPTGGGKTIASAAFAAEHCRRHGLDRIIYVLPFTSIIEQNARVLSRFFGEDAVLEHHSNARTDDGDQGGTDDDTPYCDQKRLMTENWDTPVVITTSVQFFESLFSSRPGKCRKLHNIARSVVILDEAQMLPVPLLIPCIEALKSLCGHCNSTVLLCTATQPAIAESDEFKSGLAGVREIVPSPCQLHASLRRVTADYVGKLPDLQLCEDLQQHEQALCIVNTRAHAAGLYKLLGDDECAFHLSALMCPAHRSEKLHSIRQRLSAGLPTRVVSTQLIEAGVDIDFPVVYRAIAGIDSLAQAAGRCNREGKLSDLGRLIIFEPEHRQPRGYLGRTADVGRQILLEGMDPLSLEAVTAYFRRLYWLSGSELDSKSIMKCHEQASTKGDIPFREIDDKFRMIDNATASVIIPYNDEAVRLCNELEYFESGRNTLRKLQRFVVQMHSWSVGQLEKAGAIRQITDGLYILTRKDLYDPETGLATSASVVFQIEDHIV